MADEKRISVRFGAFAVDVEGYDDPFAILTTLISHIKSASGAPLGEKGFGAKDLENAELLTALSSSAATLEMTGDADKPRLVVTAPRAETAPALTAPLVVTPDAPVMPVTVPEAEAETHENAAPVEPLAAAPESTVTAPQVDLEAESAAPQAVVEPHDVVEDDQEVVAAPDTASPEAAAMQDGDAPEATPAAPEAKAAQPVDESQTAEASAEGSTEKEITLEEVAQEEISAEQSTPDDQSDEEAGYDEEAAILRRVRRAIISADYDAPAVPKTVAKPEPKPIAVGRSPEEQKADVVRDIATTLRRIGAQTDEAEPLKVARVDEAEIPPETDPATDDVAATAKGEPKTAATAPPDQTERAQTENAPEANKPAAPRITTLSTTIPSKTAEMPKILHGATGQLTQKARKPLTMKMQIRPKAPVDAETTADAPTPAEGAAALRQTLDRDTIRERLFDLAKDDEVIDNFLFDDVGTVEADARNSDDQDDDVDDGFDDEPLILTAAEAAPLVLESPADEPLMLTDPIESPKAPPVADPQEPAEEARIEPLQLDPEPDQPTYPERPARVSEEPVETLAPAPKKGDDTAFDGFARLKEVRETPVPMMREAGTRPKRRNGGPRLVALSDETQFDKSMSPQDFAAHIGARSLHDMLEATAVYMAIVEGRTNFSRQDIMQSFARIDMSEHYTTEQRLKTFRKLLASGAITRVDERDYALSHETRFGYEAQLQA